jgi:hypothetical protein
MQSRAILDASPVGLWVKRALLLTALIAISDGRDARAEDPAPRELPRPLKFNDRALRPAALLSVSASADGAGPRIEMSTSEIRTESPAVAGAKLALDAGRNASPGTRFLWTQIYGPPVELGDPSRAAVEAIIPAGADRLEFMLIAARPDLVRVVRVNVPLVGDSSRTSWGAHPSGRVRADAGDDQVGLVGHRVTLNGSRSRPGDGKNARWLQTSGSAVSAPQQQGLFFSFVPNSPGLYRFLLMVAGDSEISEPDEVTVLVGSPPAAAGGVAMQSAAPIYPATPAPPLLTPEQIVSSSLPRLSESTRVASDVADVMEAIAQRANLYESFASLQSEMARRLDVVIPTEPSIRAAWIEGVFAPLTASTTGHLVAAGLDVRQPQVLTQPMTAAQQEIVRKHFERLARAFRAGLAAR